MATICLSPNGLDTYRAPGPVDAVLVGSIRGVVRLERSGDAWHEVGRSLEEHQIGALARDEASGTVVAAAYKPGGIFVSHDDGLTWSKDRLAVEGMRVFSLSLQRRGDKIVMFAGTEPVRLYRSDDLGESWTELPAIRQNETEHWMFPTPPRYAHLKHVAVAPDDERRMFASIEQGALLRSGDGGASWTEVESFLTPEDRFHSDIHRLVFSQADPQHLFMTTGEGFYRSLDGGTTWEHTQGLGSRLAYPDPLFVHPRQPATLIVAGAGLFPGGWTEGPTGTANAGVIRSDDEGATWHEVGSGLPEPVHGNLEAMSLHDTGAEIGLVFGTTQGEIYSSDDAGETWQLIASGLPPVSKSLHYRKFLPPEERAAVEAMLQAELKQAEAAGV
jgi:photosystem II stability/assembly factor-like uncharacterized protein